MATRNAQAFSLTKTKLRSMNQTKSSPWRDSSVALCLGKKWQAVRSWLQHSLTCPKTHTTRWRQLRLKLKGTSLAQLLCLTSTSSRPVTTNCSGRMMPTPMWSLRTLKKRGNSRSRQEKNSIRNTFQLDPSDYLKDTCKQSISISCPANL